MLQLDVLSQIVYALLSGIVLVSILGFVRAHAVFWTGTFACVLFVLAAPPWLWVVYGLCAAVVHVGFLHRVLISLPTMKVLKALNYLPVISKTEQTALDAGSVWVEGDLFAGTPDFKRLLKEPHTKLTEEEEAFLAGPVEELCGMTNDWEIHEQNDLPPEIWQFLKDKCFYGMIIPKSFGGLGFSATAHSAVIAKLASRSLPLAITVMVPNSLGPAELLVHYGTEEQKKHYLPRLASGEEIPAFALTEPGAGSDAGSLQARGVVFKDENDVLCLRLDWNKRYITLATVSTVMGLAFKLEDPDDLLGKGAHPGITCALIPTHAKGVVANRRHNPLGVPFMNCPTEGHEVVVPVDAIIGGREGVGQGWKMLMETLAAGRGISLPATAVGGAQFVARVTGAHAHVRKQFGLSIGRYEGIEEALGRIGGFAYLMEAARRFTCSGLDGGARPAVVTAMAKYNLTELYRKAINDGMDILGGNAIVKGPRNLLAHGYIGAPIAITVEGANILTRSLIIFGQGAIRCHPYLYQEVKALQANDLKAFDAALWKHLGYLLCNAIRTGVLAKSSGFLAPTGIRGPARRYAQKLTWASSTFALLSDVALITLGAELKRKESISGRFADIFSWLYLGLATLHRFENDGRRKEDEPFLHWSMQYTLTQIQQGFEDLFKNMKVPGLTLFLRGPVWLFSRINPMGTNPPHWLAHKIAQALQTPGPHRDALTSGIYVSESQEDALGRLERALRLCHQAESILRKLKDATRAGTLPKKRPAEVLSEALKLGIVSEAEKLQWEEAEAARAEVIQVDDFVYELSKRAQPAGEMASVG